MQPSELCSVTINALKIREGSGCSQCCMVALWFPTLRNVEGGGSPTNWLTSLCFRNDFRVSPHQ